MLLFLQISPFISGSVLTTDDVPRRVNETTSPFRALTDAPLIEHPAVPMLTPAIEDYLKTIYKLETKGTVQTSEIARELDVAAASVTAMVKRLARHGFVRHESYKGVQLTATGRKIALEIIRHHRLLETYLREVMGYSWRELHDEAEQLEHHISEEFEDKIDAMLGNPTHDPHGHPIPTRDGQVEEPSDRTLAECDEGMRCTIDHLCDRDPDLLHYLEDLGMLPGASVEIISKGPFKGPVAVRVGEDEQTIGFEVAQSIFVSG